MGWVSPTDYIDALNDWTNEANTYDEDTGTFSWYSGDGGSLILTLGAAIDCDKVRIFSSDVPASVTIQVYYESAWHEIYSGAIASGEWVEKTIPAGTKSVYQASITYDTAFKYVNEFDFNEVTGGVIHYGAATLAGTGTLAGIGALILTGLTTLAGTGTLAGIGRRIFTGKSTLSGLGTLTTAGRLIPIGKAILSGTGTLSAVGRRIFTGAVILAGSGALAIAGRTTAIGKATLSGTGTLAAIGTVGETHYGAVTFTGSGTLAAIGERIVAGQAILSGSGSLTIDGQAILAGVAILSGAGNLSANAVAMLIGQATLAGIGTLAAQGGRIVIGQATLSGVGSLSAIGTVAGLIRYGIVSFTGSGFLAVFAVRIVGILKRQPSGFHDLGKIKTITYSLGSSLKEYTLGRRRN